MLLLFFLWSLNSIYWSALLSRFYWIRIVYTSDDMILHTRQIFYSSTSDHYYRMLLKSMLFTWYVCNHLNTIWKPYLSNLSLCRIRFLRFSNSNLETYPTFEWSRNKNFLITLKLINTKLKRWGLRLIFLRFSSVLNQLIDSRHSTLLKWR